MRTVCLFFQVAPEAWELLTYIPPYGEKFEYSHSHFLYTNDIQRLEDIPPPHTAPTRKQEIFDVDAYSYVDERTDAVSSLYMGRNARKPVFGGFRTTQAQTSLRIRAV